MKVFSHLVISFSIKTRIIHDCVILYCLFIIVFLSCMHPEITLSLAVLKKNFNLNYNMTFIRIVLFCFVVSLTTQGQILNKKNLTAYDGFFKFFYEKENDKIYLEVDSLKTEFLYINSLASGIGSNDIGLDRGKLGQERLVYFKKAGNKLLLIQPNLKYRANTKNDLERKKYRTGLCQISSFWV
jgi:hypothetical protein